jgi:hypothetical protein
MNTFITPSFLSSVAFANSFGLEDRRSQDSVCGANRGCGRLDPQPDFSCALVLGRLLGIQGRKSPDLWCCRLNPRQSERSRADGFRAECARCSGRVDPAGPPPCPFIAMAVDFAMVASAEGDDELVTDVAPQSPALGKPQMMRIGRAATANQAGLLGYMADVVAIPHPAWLRQRQRSFINDLGA